MRAEKINIYTYTPNFSGNKNKVKNNAGANSFDSVNFTGKKEKAEHKSLLERISDFFTEIIPEEAKISDDIDIMAEAVKKQAKSIQKDGKIRYSLAKNIIGAGKENGFNSYKLFGDKEDKTVVFGWNNEKTGLPESASIVAVKGGYRPVRVFEFHDGLNFITVKDFDIEGCETISSILNGKIVYYKEKGLEDDIVKEFAFTKNGITYQCSEEKSDGQTKIIAEAELSTDGNQKSTFNVLDDDDNTLKLYSYNDKSGFWELED